MSKPPAPPLHLEWTPGWVRAADTATGRVAEADRLSALAPLLNGRRRVLVGVGRPRVFLKAVRLPRASREDLRRIVTVQLGNLFPVPPAQLAFDFFQTDDQAPDGWLTLVAAIRADDLREIRAALKAAGLSAARILPVALAAPAVAARAGAADALVAERGPSGLALDVVQNGVLRLSRVAPGDSDPEWEARRTLAAAGAGDPPVIAVGPAALPRAVAGGDTALSLLHEAPPFHFELAEERERAERRRADDRLRLAVLLLLAAVLLAALVWADRQDARAAVRRSQGTWTRQFLRYQARLDDGIARLGEAQAAEDALTRAFTPAQPLSDVCAVVAAALPPGAWLTGLTAERGKPLLVRGTAKTSGDVARFMATLGASPRFRDVRLVFANSGAIGKAPVIQFNVSAVCVGNLPMPAPERAPTGGARAPTEATPP